MGTWFCVEIFGGLEGKCGGKAVNLYGVRHQHSKGGISSIKA